MAHLYACSNASVMHMHMFVNYTSPGVRPLSLKSSYLENYGPLHVESPNLR